MAARNPSDNYDWVLPIPGGSVGAWGDMLNKIIAEDGTPLGVDGVLGAIQSEIGDEATDIAALDSRVTDLEGDGATAFYFRGILSGFDASIPEGTLTQIGFDEQFSFGNMGHAAGLVTLPAGSDGLYVVNANVTVEFHAVLDDSRKWRMEIQKNGTPIATASTPSLDDGVSAGSGNITLAASTTDRAEAGDRFNVLVFQTGPGGNADVIGTVDGATFFEVVRIAA